MNQVQYRVYLTPRIALGVYGAEVEISDYVALSGNSQISKSIDSTDFTICLYTFNDVTLICDNSQGLFSDFSDSRSLFIYSRDLALIRIVYDNTGGVSPPLIYKGLVQEEATSVDLEQDQLTFTILGLDSVLRKNIVPAQAVSNRMLASAAFATILGTPDITSVLRFSSSNVNLAYNCTVDLGAKFDNISKADAVTKLLGACNSVLLIDSSGNIIIQGRNANYGNPINYFYGKGDQNGRENVINLTNYDNGYQRLFNSIVITTGNDQSNNPTEVHDDISIKTFGLRQKSLSFDFLDGMNNPSNVLGVAHALRDEFKFPKPELEVEVPTDLVSSVELLDLCSINFPFMTLPTGPFLPVCGITTCGDSNYPLPKITGALAIDPSWGWKVIQRDDNIDIFTTVLTIRQMGVSSTDGILP